MRGAWGRCCAPSLVLWSGYGVGVVVTGECGEVCRKNPGDRTSCVAGVGPLCPLVWPSHPHVGLLVRTWAFSSARGPSRPHVGLLVRTWASSFEPGQPRPHAEQAARVWDSRLMCGTGRPRVGGGGPTPGSPHRARTRYAEPGPSCPHVDPLFRAWATPPTCGIGGPRAGQVAHVRDVRELESLSHAANP